MTTLVDNACVAAGSATWPQDFVGRFFALVMLMLPCSLSGCQMTHAGENHGVTASQFQDVVVPDGFLLRDAGHESYSREEAGWRQGHFVYRGSMAPAEAMNYVRERSPQHNWTMVEEQTNVDTGSRLRFERGVYSADYTFLRTEGSTRMVVDYTTDYSRR